MATPGSSFTRTPLGHEDNLEIHWCAKIKHEVEKLAYQLNDEAKRTERPIRRLSKLMYGSTCADIQVDVNGGVSESIKHVVGSEDIERMDWPARSPDLDPFEHVSGGFSGQTLGSSKDYYLTTSNDSGASIGAARRMAD
ncbi:uncharacterized protein TNCV_4067921 [Trichonephila clavipes]|nr:uncharacterized protein TNCV_4067921 [Trichonephila clavipes]